ncbi:MAG: mechanosensitive ion channel [Henriciella sp.]|nr:mechanosensitive ion channel [Henriciella sp.]
MLKRFELWLWYRLQDTSPASDPPPDEQVSDPLTAISDTAEDATQAATEFFSWVRSGQREALLAVALIISVLILLMLFRWAVLKGIVQLPRADDYSFSAMFQRLVRRFRTYFMFAIALQVANSVFAFPATLSAFTHVLFVLTLVLQTSEWVREFALSFMLRNVHRRPGDAVALASAFNIIKWFINIAIATVALLLILDNVGADVTALLAGLGIGGIAIGIAAQGVFRDLFSSLSIVLDKPFQVGDTIRYGETWGDIEDIGLKTTRIRSRSGEQIVISNTNLLEQELHNMQRMTRRRIETGFGIIYQTDAELAEQVPGIVAQMMREIPEVVFDRCGMSAFGPSSLDYSLVFYTLKPDYNAAMAARSKVLLGLLATFREHGIEFAYPTQTLYIEGMPSPAVNGRPVKAT